MRSLKLKLTYSRYLIFVCLHMFLPWTCAILSFPQEGAGVGGGGHATVGILVNTALWLSASALLTSLIPTRPYHPYAYIWALKLISFPRAYPYRFKFGGFDLRFKSKFFLKKSEKQSTTRPRDVRVPKQAAWQLSVPIILYLLSFDKVDP